MSLSSVFSNFNTSVVGDRDHGQLGQQLIRIKMALSGNRSQTGVGTAVSAATAAGIHLAANLSMSSKRVLRTTLPFEYLTTTMDPTDAESYVNDTLNGTSSDTDEFKLPYSYPEMVLIAIVAGFLSLLTVAGNCMVMISFKIDKQLQTISNYFLFSLAVADFAIGLISMPLYTLYTLAGRWQLGPHVCDTWLSLDYLASNASVLNLLIISFDRYFSVTRPLTYRARRTPRRAGIMIAAAWVISLVLWPPWIYSWPYIEGTRKVPEDKCFIQFIETNYLITLGTAIAAFYGPVTVMCVLYWRVWRETENRQKDLVNLQAGKKNDSHRSNSSGEEQLVVAEVPMVDSTHHVGAAGLADWRRSRSESGGAVEEIETTYVPAAACLPGTHRRRQNVSWTSWNYWRRWTRLSTWQHWIGTLGRRRSGKSGEYGEEESFSDGSNLGTPASADTPLASSISRGTSLNVIRDPYATTPVRYKSDARLANLERRRTLVASKSLTADGKGDAVTPLLRSQVAGSKSEAGDSPCDTAARLSNRSHSADSVFTIVIRLPRDSSIESAEHPTIRMIPIPNHDNNSEDQSGGSGRIKADRSPRPPRPQDRQHHLQPALRSKSVPVGGVVNPLPRPHGLPQSNSTSTSSSFLCGTNLHLPNALSLSKLTSLTKPNHLPLKGKLKNNQASPWVPRSCMPVAQSPLLVRCTRFDGSTSTTTTANSGSSGPRTAANANARQSGSTSNLPLDTKIIPKQLARTGGAANVQTVSGSVSGVHAGFPGIGGGVGGGPPARRLLPHIYQAQQAAAAAAAKKAAKKPKKKNVEKKQERKAAKTLSAILLAFILTWTPYNVLILLKALTRGKDDYIPAELWNFCYYLCYINSTVNPVCYALCNASFRRTYVRILTCKWHSRTKTAVQRGFYN